MGFELPNGKTARNIQDQVKFLSEKLKDLYAAFNQSGLKKIEIVEELPEVGNPAVLYLVPVEDPETGNYYDEYMWIDGAWELIGTTRVDLSDYCTLSTDQTITGKKTLTKDLTLFAESGDSPSIDFLRGNLDDNLTDYKIVDSAGYLYFKQRGQNDSDFTTTLSIEGKNNLRVYNQLITNAAKPSSSGLYDLGSSTANWKDFYLSGSINLAGPNYTASILNDSNRLKIRYSANDKVVIGNSDFIIYGSPAPSINNTYDLGSSDLQWKDLYLSGNVIFGSSGHKIFVDGSVLRFEAGNANTFVFKGSIRPSTNASSNLGGTSYKWNNLYLSGDLTDGTNSVTVADIGKKIYKHDILFSNSSVSYYFSFYSTSSTAITSVADLEAAVGNVKGCMGVMTSDDTRYTGFYIINVQSSVVYITNGLAGQVMASLASVNIVSDTVTAL